jgi:hypothetical protein
MMAIIVMEAIVVVREAVVFIAVILVPPTRLAKNRMIVVFPMIPAVNAATDRSPVMRFATPTALVRIS